MRGICVVLCSRNAHDQNVLALWSQWNHTGVLPTAYFLLPA